MTKWYRTKNSFESDHRGKSQETSAEWLNGRPDPGKKEKKNSNKRTELISRLIKNMFVLQLV